MNKMPVQLSLLPEQNTHILLKKETINQIGGGCEILMNMGMSSFQDNAESGMAMIICLNPALQSENEANPNISAWPNDAEICSLFDIIEIDDVPARFFLSPKACAGILRRSKKHKRGLPSKLEAALSKTADLLVSNHIISETKNNEKQNAIVPEMEYPWLKNTDIILGSDMLLLGDAITRLKDIPDKSVNCCITSPPYWGLRTYECEGQIGLEDNLEAYLGRLLPIFDEIWRVLIDTGSLWLNIGDSYIGYHGNKNASDGGALSDFPGFQENIRKTTVGMCGLKNKDLAGIPWRLAFALQDRGWHLRSDIIWHKPNGKPESVRDRPTRAHEYIFLLTKSDRYYFDYKSFREPANTKPSKCSRERGKLKGLPTIQPNKGTRPTMPEKKGSMGTPLDGLRNRRDVWTIKPARGNGIHFATFPPELIYPCVVAGCPKNGLILDPFAGTGTVGIVCMENQRSFLGIEINPEYLTYAGKRLEKHLHNLRASGKFQNVA